MFRLALLLCLLVAARDTSANQSGRPNVVLLMCDDLGWGDVGFQGNTIIRTPHLDEMAAAGMVFSRFYAHAPVCSPTRGSCLTGRHAHRYGVFFANSGHLPQSEITLAEALRPLGYRTGHFGKWHLGTLTVDVNDSNRGGPRNRQHFAPPWQHGFALCFSTEAKVPTYDPMYKPLDAGQHAWDYLRPDQPSAAYGTHYWNEDGTIVDGPLDGDDSKLIVDRVIPFLERSVDLEQPFLAVVWFHAPHLPVVAGPDHLPAYRQHPLRHRNYYGCVTAMDQQVGRLRAALRKLRVDNNTLIAFCSDNGPEGTRAAAPGSTGALRGRKRSLYEGGVRVPAVIEWPAVVRAGSSTNCPAVTSDYLPTILEVVGARMPDDRPLDGESLLPILTGRSQARRSRIGFQSRGQAAWMGNRHKIIRQNDDAAWELYDLTADQGEANDLAAAQPELVRSLAGEFDAWQASCAASWQAADE